ncbi:MAG: phosphoribosylanthranilate isomerase [Spirochaetia bacterium]|nr:phosphoribosylanthranilate isomerase [Spirochaetia bacterium]
MRIKICGITNLKDARLAQALGANILGFVFADSPRKITPLQAKEIIRRIKPSVLKAGVFVNEDIAKLNDTVKKAGLNFVQLHGDESPAYIRKVRNARVIKAVKVKNRAYIKAQVKKYGKCVDALLFDTYNDRAHGGTGDVFDRRLLKGIKKTFFLAGGLNPGNVYAAIKTVRPYAVDVSSGVESTKGKKDAVKMKQFFKMARKAEKDYRL